MGQCTALDLAVIKGTSESVLATLLSRGALRGGSDPWKPEDIYAIAATRPKALKFMKASIINTQNNGSALHVALQNFTKNPKAAEIAINNLVARGIDLSILNDAGITAAEESMYVYSLPITIAQRMGRVVHSMPLTISIDNEVEEKKEPDSPRRPVPESKGDNEVKSDELKIEAQKYAKTLATHIGKKDYNVIPNEQVMHLQGRRRSGHVATQC